MLLSQARVLVVDDEPSVAEYVATVLREVGFETRLAADGASALAELDADAGGVGGGAPGAEAPPRFDLLVTDVAMPGGIDGWALARAAREKQPELRVLYMSGRMPAAAVDPRREEFIRKPFGAAELLGCVFEILTRDPLGGPNRSRPPLRSPAAPAA